MSEYCQRFFFAVDMNGDTIFTISDVGLFVKAMFFLPAQITMSVVDRVPGMVRFFETDCATGWSWGGAVFSLFVWYLMVISAWKD